MRFVIFGAGAIGGVLGARLHQSGREVALLARGAHYEAIARDGLRLETPEEDVVLEIPVYPDPGALSWGADDVVLVCTKTQDTAGALVALAAAASADVPVFCVQNGVENERLALRIFRDVYGALVMAPKAAPMSTATARSTTLPRRMKSRNPLSMEKPPEIKSESIPLYSRRV